MTAITLRPRENTHCLDLRTNNRNCLLSEPTVQISVGVKKESNLAMAVTSLNASHYKADPSLRCRSETASFLRYFRFDSYNSAVFSRRVLV